MNKFAKKSLSAACAVVMLSTFTVNAYAGSLPEGKGPIGVFSKPDAVHGIIGEMLFNDVKLDALTDIERLVGDLYNTILGRSASQSEIEWYASLLADGGAVADVVRAFFDSAEFAGKNVSNEVYVEILYRGVLGRGAGKSEMSGYVETLNNGASRSGLLEIFISSAEFQGRCEAYGLTAKNDSPVSVADDKADDDSVNVAGIQAYVLRLYKMVLGRGASEHELNERLEEILSGRNTAGQMAAEFFGSPEYERTNSGTVDYITTLYKTILGRGASESEIAYYVNEIENNGFTRRKVLANFVASKEFAGICAGYGVPVGTVGLSVYDDNPQINQFVRRQYKTVLGRGASESEIRERTEQLVNGSSAAQMTYEFFNSPEFKNRNLSDEDYIVTLYRGVLGRGASRSEIDEYLQVLKNGASRNHLFSRFVYSPEFANLCGGYGMSVGTANIEDNVEASPPAGSNGKDDDNQAAWDNETLTVRYNGQNVTDTVENILVKTVYAEVGGFRNTEVYKAQAVAAYTYIRYHNSRGSIPSLPLSTPSSSVNSEILSAVRSVKNQSLTYNGALAQTTYYAMSSGKTNSSADIWKTNLGYLVSVDSKYDVNATNYKATKTFTLDEFYAIMDKIYGGRAMYNTSGDPSTWIKTTKNSGGYVTSINLCSRTPSPEYFYQTMFGLRSPAFDVSYNSGNKTFTFTTYGYGHGVGMSQWGAYYYAVNEGWSYEQILAHYFPGTTLTK